MTRRTYAALSAALALSACAAPASTPAPQPAPASGPMSMGAQSSPVAAHSAAPGLTMEQAVATITPQDVYARIEFLASDRMRGRDTPSPELEIAASYLVNQYKLWGMQAGGENNTFYQWWPFPLRRLRAAGAGLELRGSAGSQSLRLGRDFFARGGTAQPLSAAGVVYAGRAADGSLAEGSLRDRVVVTALPGNGGSRDWRLERNRQASAAQRAGASAIVYVLEPSWTADSIAAYAAQTAAGARSSGASAGFPQYFVTYAAAQQFFRAGGMSLDEQWRGAATARPVPLAGITASGALPVENADDRSAPNVVAILPGSDPALRNEYVVLSAHMDHVGVGRPVNGDSIYNGADDDASGTTGLLEVAEAFARLGVRPRRSIIFLHVSGEEKGLLGSQWYSDHPTVPLAQIVANVNVDMIGRNSPDSVVVIGKNYSTLGQVANFVGRQHPELGLTLSDDIWPQERFFFRSDHYNFARKEVPALFFFSGVHPDYHLPSDEVEKIDTDKAARISRMVFYLVNEIANAQDRPRWDPRGLEEVRRMTR